MLDKIAHSIQKTLEKHNELLVFNYQKHQNVYGDYISINYAIADKRFNQGSRKLLVMKEGGFYIVTDDNLISSGIPLKYDNSKPRTEKDTEKMFSVFYRFKDEVKYCGGTEFLIALKDDDWDVIEVYVSNLETVIKRLLET